MRESATNRAPDQMPEGATKRKHGQFILDVMAAEERRKRAGDPFLEAINQAHRARAEADRR